MSRSKVLADFCVINQIVKIKHFCRYSLQRIKKPL